MGGLLDSSSDDDDAPAAAPPAAARKKGLLDSSSDEDESDEGSEERKTAGTKPPPRKASPVIDLAASSDDEAPPARGASRVDEMSVKDLKALIARWPRRGLQAAARLKRPAEAARPPARGGGRGRAPSPRSSSEAAAGPFSAGDGRAVVFMGFRARPDLKDELAALVASVGGRAVSTVSGKTALLVTGTLGAEGGHSSFSNLERAVEGDVPVVDAARLRRASSRAPSARRSGDGGAAAAAALVAAHPQLDAMLYDGVRALQVCGDDAARAAAWLRDDPEQFALSRLRTSVDAAEVDRSLAACKPFEPRPWRCSEDNVTRICVLVEFPERSNPVSAGPEGHMTLLYIEDWHDARWGDISQRITQQHLSTIRRLVAAVDPTAGSGSSRRAVSGTFEFSRERGQVDPGGVIAELRQAIVGETGLPFRSTGSSDLAACEGHVTAGLAGPPDRVADSGHFKGCPVYDLPLRLKVAACPGIRRAENQELYRWCWLGLPEVLGISAAVAEAHEPIRAGMDFSTIKGIGAKRAEYLKAFFEQRSSDDPPRAPSPAAFAGPGQTLAGVPVLKPLAPAELRAARLALFG
ncbi:hypothetical protein JL721_624 [Aureococcus anophagefferens]|nr:hypothetical protein JL721_624 [Aureococcus anophagefferens]